MRIVLIHTHTETWRTILHTLLYTTFHIIENLGRMQCYKYCLTSYNIHRSTSSLVVECWYLCWFESAAPVCCNCGFIQQMFHCRGPESCYILNYWHRLFNILKYNICYTKYCVGVCICHMCHYVVVLWKKKLYFCDVYHSYNINNDKSTKTELTNKWKTWIEKMLQRKIVT